MSLEEVTEKTTMEFPKSLTLDESEELLMYLAKHLPADISYKREQHKSLTNQNGEVFIGQGTAHLNAHIRSLENPICSDNLQLEHSEEDLSKLAKIEFTTIPGYDKLSEYEIDRIEFWDKTREVVEKYFSEQ